MLKKIVKYTDYNGENREDVLYFSLNKAELLRMNMSKRGGMENYIQNLIDENDPEKLTKTFEELILGSYGVKSEDGTRFIKSPEIVENFKNSAAYAEVFYEMATDTNAFIDFMNSVIPSELAAEIEKTGELDKIKQKANIQALPQT